MIKSQSILLYFTLSYNKFKCIDRRIISYLNLYTLIFSHKKRVAYIGWVGRDNLGDEALYEAHKQFFSGVHLHVFTNRTSLQLFTLLHKKKQYHYGILGGGSLINGGNRYLQDIKCLTKNHIPMFCMGTGVLLSYDDSASQNMAEWIEILSSFKYVGVLGPLSKQILEKHGLAKAEIIGDTALSLSKKTYLPKKGNKVLDINISCAPTNRQNPESVLTLLQPVCKVYIQRGWKIWLLPCWINDLRITYSLAQSLGKSSCRIINSWNSLSSFLDATEQCDLFIGEKLHSVVLATVTRTPSIMIEYQLKCRDFMESISCGEWCLPLKTLTKEAQISKIELLSDIISGHQKFIDTEIIFYAKKRRSVFQSIFPLYLIA